MRVELVLCTYLILICCVLIVEDAEDIVCFVASSPSKGTGIKHRAISHQRPAPTGYRHNRSIFDPNRTSLTSNDYIRSQADATITPSTQKMLVNGTTLLLPSLPKPLAKRKKKKPNNRQKTEELTSSQSSSIPSAALSQAHSPNCPSPASPNDSTNTAWP